MKILKKQLVQCTKEYEVFDVMVARKCRCKGTVSVAFKVKIEYRGVYCTYKLLNETPRIDHETNCHELKLETPKSMITFELVASIFKDKHIIDFSSQCIDDEKQIFEVVQRERCEGCGGIVMSRMNIQLYDRTYCFFYRVYNYQVSFGHKKECQKFENMDTDLYPFLNVSTRLTPTFFEDLFPGWRKTMWFEEINDESELEDEDVRGHELNPQDCLDLFNDINSIH